MPSLTVKVTSTSAAGPRLELIGPPAIRLSVNVWPVSGFAGSAVTKPGWSTLTINDAAGVIVVVPPCSVDMPPPLATTIVELVVPLQVRLGIVDGDKIIGSSVVIA